MSNLAMMMMAMSEDGPGPGGPGFSGGPYSVFSGGGTPGEFTAGVIIAIDGAVEGFNQDGPLPDEGRWDGGGSENKVDYQFRYDATGTTPNDGSDPINVWLPASAGSDRWLQTTTFGVRDSDGTVRMRLAVSPFTEFASTTLRLICEST